MRTIVVVPTIREKSIRQFLTSWQPYFADNDARTVSVYVIEDHPEPAFDVRRSASAVGCEQYSHQEIERDLGADAWVIPRGTDCVRSYGFWKAWQRKPDMIVTMDDDVRPTGDSFLEVHYRALCHPTGSPAWTSTLEGLKPRGMPFFGRLREWPTAVNHGLWEGKLDLDAVTALRDQWDTDLPTQAIPPGQYFPMCGMNLAFRPTLVPALYFGLQGPAYPYDRFGDIWAGLFVKKICDHLGLGVRSGTPHVRHEQASDVWENLRKEVPGLEVNEWLWESVDRVRLTGTTVLECYAEIADKLDVEGEYWDTLRRAMHVWAELYQ